MSAKFTQAALDTVYPAMEELHEEIKKMLLEHKSDDMQVMEARMEYDILQRHMLKNPVGMEHQYPAFQLYDDEVHLVLQYVVHVPGNYPLKELWPEHLEPLTLRINTYGEDNEIADEIEYARNKSGNWDRVTMEVETIDEAPYATLQSAETGISKQDMMEVIKRLIRGEQSQ